MSGSSLATIDGNSSPTLTASAAGTLTLSATATSGSASAQAQITIVAAGSLAPDRLLNCVIFCERLLPKFQL